MLSVVKNKDHYKIRNKDKKKTYPTKYKSKAAAQRKKKVIEDWFKRRARYASS